MLIGLMAKNGILLVEFVNPMRDRRQRAYDSLTDKVTMSAPGQGTLCGVTCSFVDFGGSYCQLTTARATAQTSTRRAPPRFNILASSPTVDPVVTTSSTTTTC